MNEVPPVESDIAASPMEATLTKQASKPASPSRLGGVVRGLRFQVLRRWRRFWLARSGPQGFGKVAAWLASRHSLPYHQMSYLADMFPQGFVAPRARVGHPGLRLGNHVFLGDGVIVYRTSEGGPVDLRDRVHLYGDTFVETGMGGRVLIDEGTHIQPGCHIHAFLSEVKIGRQVEIAPGCGFYCYDHGMAPGVPIMEQPLKSKGGISVGDGAWIGYGVTVLQGVSIGEGAVIAAGSVVVHDIPDNAVAAGSPAKVVKFRDGNPPKASHFQSDLTSIE